MNEKDARPDPKTLSDEDLLVELGVAVGSMTALEMALDRGTVRFEALSHVQAGVNEWLRRADVLEQEIGARGYSIVVREDRMGFFSRRRGKG